MIGLDISVREHGCKVKCFDRISDLLSPAESNALGDISHERGLNFD